MKIAQYTHVLWTDGAIVGGQGGRASWASLVDSLGRGSSLCLWGLLPRPSTSNAAELTACVRGLQALPGASTVLVVTDSAYVQRAILRPTAGDSHPTLRADLKTGIARHQRIGVRLVASHTGIGGNEFVDRVAKLALWNPTLLRSHPPEMIPLQEISLKEIA